MSYINLIDLVPMAAVIIGTVFFIIGLQPHRPNTPGHGHGKMNKIHRR